MITINDPHGKLPNGVVAAAQHASDLGANMFGSSSLDSVIYEEELVHWKNRMAKAFRITGVDVLSLFKGYSDMCMSFVVGVGVPNVAKVALTMARFHELRDGVWLWYEAFSP